MIYVNCFPVDEDWAEKKIKKGKETTTIPAWYDGLFQVFDGGHSFWQSRINLETKKLTDISVNGVA